jgi:hypothetical protein
LPCPSVSFQLCAAAAAAAGAMAAEEQAVSYQEVAPAIQLNGSEYALHAVFTQFEALADNKIKLMLSTSVVRNTLHLSCTSLLYRIIHPVL